MPERSSWDSLGKWQRSATSEPMRQRWSPGVTMWNAWSSSSSAIRLPMMYGRQESFSQKWDRRLMKYFEACSFDSCQAEHQDLWGAQENLQRALLSNIYWNHGTLLLQWSGAAWSGEYIDACGNTAKSLRVLQHRQHTWNRDHEATHARCVRCWKAEATVCRVFTHVREGSTDRFGGWSGYKGCRRPQRAIQGPRKPGEHSETQAPWAGIWEEKGTAEGRQASTTKAPEKHVHSL